MPETTPSPNVADTPAPNSVFWNEPEADLLKRLGTRPEGLTDTQAKAALEGAQKFRIKPKENTAAIMLFLGQFKSPVSLILIGAAVLSFFLADAADGGIICLILFVSGLLGFIQEKGAADASAKLLKLVQVAIQVRRNNQTLDLPIEAIAPGDIIELNAGDMIPGDCRVLSAKDLYTDEASLTGESYPAEKLPVNLPPDAPLAKRSNVLHMGTHVVSGQGTAVVAHTGTRTEFGKVSESLHHEAPETDFKKGIRTFGYLLMQISLVLIVLIFAFNVLLHKPLLDSFLFSLAIAVGLTPQLLPAIISVNLAQGARVMARENVIVKRMESIENFGNMNILCTDKTGTLTQGIMKLTSATDLLEQPSERLNLYAYLNASLQTGFLNPIDKALSEVRPPEAEAYTKLDEVPYDFIRKRLSVLVSGHEGTVLITKGAVAEVLAICSSLDRNGAAVPIEPEKASVMAYFKKLSEAGSRTLALAYKIIPGKTAHKEDETGLTLLGFLAFDDPPKEGISQVLAGLKAAGVGLKIITGDNVLVAAAIGKKVGVPNPMVISGKDMLHMSNEALQRQALRADIFAEVEPNQKERILILLKRAGKVVGYMGDGINDASALHTADVGISVDEAVDVAKEAADIVLLSKDLNVILTGIKAGRRTFANTLKYVFMATSANFGNMFSMAGASLMLPFLPLLPSQILLTNLLTDLPQMTIATDNVDEGFIAAPHRWDISFIRKFMFVFGLISSVFDYATFGVLYYILNARPEEFRTGWFTESVVSAALIVLVVRTKFSVFKSKPSKLLTGATLAIVCVAVALPYSPAAHFLGLVPLPLNFYGYLTAIVAAYLITAEAAKTVFYRLVKL